MALDWPIVAPTVFAIVFNSAPVKACDKEVVSVSDTVPEKSSDKDASRLATTLAAVPTFSSLITIVWSVHANERTICCATSAFNVTSVVDAISSLPLKLCK